MPRLNIYAKQDLLMAMDPIGLGSWISCKQCNHRRQLSCPGLHEVPGCPGSWPWLPIARCNLFQTMAMSVARLNELLTIALGVGVMNKIPTLHIGELTQASTHLYVRPCYMFDIVTPLLVC